MHAPDGSCRKPAGARAPVKGGTGGHRARAPRPTAGVAAARPQPGRRGPPSGAGRYAAFPVACLVTSGRWDARPPARVRAMATARPMAARRALRGRRAAEWAGRRQQLTAGREALIAPYPRTPAQPAPQGTDRAPLPPAQSTAPRTRSGHGGMGGARPRARAGGRGASPRQRQYRGRAVYRSWGLPSPSPSRRSAPLEPNRVGFVLVVPAGGTSGLSGLFVGLVTGYIVHQCVKREDLRIEISSKDGKEVIR